MARFSGEVQRSESTRPSGIGPDLFYMKLVGPIENSLSYLRVCLR